MQTVEIFYAIDEPYIRYATVSVYSLIDHISYDRNYHIHILNCGIPEESLKPIMRLKKDNVSITSDDVTAYMESMKQKLPVRDYYSITTYYRFVISELFPELEKALYIDGDTIVLDDVGKLFDTDITNYYLAASRERIMSFFQSGGDYAEKCLGVKRDLYFNAGVMLINCGQFRDHYILDRFIQLLHTYTFTVAQDQDYLNVLAKDHVLYLEPRWNVELACPMLCKLSEAGILHYIFSGKPWHGTEVQCGFVFWQYAKETEFYQSLKEEAENYPEEKKEKDKHIDEHVIAACDYEANNPNNFLCRLNRSERAQDRVTVLEKIDALERKGIFDQDVEEDPPGKVLLPEDIDYIHKSVLERLKRSYAYYMARRFLNNLITSEKLIVNEIDGVENIQGLDTGAILTCNHFNPLDSFAVQMVYELTDQKRRFYRVIKEGNYTSFPGFYGFLMRHCNTLPLSSNLKTMKKFLSGVDYLLKEGNYILIYPEQSLWWNYRKPKPLKKGGFTMASKAGVPVLPIFITMQDTEKMGEDGFPVQAYTIHICKPIYPDKNLSIPDNAEMMMNKNYEAWKNIYEKVYQTKLTYLCDEMKKA